MKLLDLLESVVELLELVGAGEGLDLLLALAVLVFVDVLQAVGALLEKITRKRL